MSKQLKEDIIETVGGAVIFIALFAVCFCGLVQAARNGAFQNFHSNHALNEAIVQGGYARAKAGK